MSSARPGVSMEVENNFTLIPLTPVDVFVSRSFYVSERAVVMYEIKKKKPSLNK